MVYYLSELNLNDFLNFPLLNNFYHKKYIYILNFEMVFFNYFPKKVSELQSIIQNIFDYSFTNRFFVLR